MSGIWRLCFMVLATAGCIALGPAAALAQIDAPTTQFLQTAAWETVQEYYRK